MTEQTRFFTPKNDLKRPLLSSGNIEITVTSVQSDREVSDAKSRPIIANPQFTKEEAKILRRGSPLKLEPKGLSIQSATMYGFIWAASVVTTALSIWNFATLSNKMSEVDDALNHDPQAKLDGATCLASVGPAGPPENPCKYDHSDYTPEFIEACGPDISRACYLDNLRTAPTLGMAFGLAGTLVTPFRAYCAHTSFVKLTKNDMAILQEAGYGPQDGETDQAYEKRILLEVEKPGVKATLNIAAHRIQTRTAGPAREAGTGEERIEVAAASSYQ